MPRPLYHANVIRLQMTVTDIGRMRFVYSPLVEVAESLYLLAKEDVPQLHRSWLRTVRTDLAGVDMTLLHAVVPARNWMARFFFDGPAATSVTMDGQLRYLADLPHEVLHRDLGEVWHGTPFPRPVQEVLNDPCGSERLAEAVWRYWEAAIEPHWRSIRSVLDEDVAYRAAELTRGGLDGMLGALHSRVSVEEDALRIDLRGAPERPAGGVGLLLMPSVFVWPNIAFGFNPAGAPRLTYAARGIGRLWDPDGLDDTDEDALGALLGRSRAAILTALETAHSTTELSVLLAQSKPAVSQHLAVLRRSGLVTSRRSGRSVMYHRTPLATSVIDAHRAYPGQAAAGGGL
jgi:DNA-binding transcriptional ArsR family regulator